MLVKFSNNWFAPGGDFYKDSRHFSGIRFKKGIHEVPEELAKYLPPPPFAIILDENSVRPEKLSNPVETLSQYDTARKAADDEIKLRKELSEEDKEKARVRIAKARQARLDKLAAQKAEEKEAA